MDAEAVSGQITRCDQRSNMKIESLHGKNPTEIHNNMREVCRDYVVDHSTVSWWPARFHEGRLSTEDNPRIKISVRINLPLFSTVVPSNIYIHTYI